MFVCLPVCLLLASSNLAMYFSISSVQPPYFLLISSVLLNQISIHDYLPTLYFFLYYFDIFWYLSYLKIYPRYLRDFCFLSKLEFHAHLRTPPSDIHMMVLGGWWHLSRLESREETCVPRDQIPLFFLSLYIFPCSSRHSSVPCSFLLLLPILVE